MVQKLPSLFIDNLLDESVEENKGYYHSASYTGYTVSIQQEQVEGEDEEGNRVTTDGDEVETASFNVILTVNGRESAYKPEAEQSDGSAEESSGTEAETAE